MMVRECSKAHSNSKIYEAINAERYRQVLEQLVLNKGLHMRSTFKLTLVQYIKWKLLWLILYMTPYK